LSDNIKTGAVRDRMTVTRGSSSTLEEEEEEEEEKEEDGREQRKWRTFRKVFFPPSGLSLFISNVFEAS
jgi:hypothetical protein